MSDPARLKDWVAITLAVGLATAINCMTFGILYDAIHSSEPGISENATQILTTAFGGIIGVLGSYIGFKAGTVNGHEPPAEPPRHATDDTA